ncbi:hypothetical protein E2C01_072766 [Portunus trituberculatus]|uniref:Uncharacterized protein n=1 Tax=Portunus trituberculatus TaxID=210409 RepID=A0A5B7HYX6_PORTR|nr:hypothetical protein [Portunus trituberculatus]
MLLEGFINTGGHTRDHLRGPAQPHARQGKACCAAARPQRTQQNSLFKEVTVSSLTVPQAPTQRRVAAAGASRTLAGPQDGLSVFMNDVRDALGPDRGGRLVRLAACHTNYRPTRQRRQALYDNVALQINLKTGHTDLPSPSPSLCPSLPPSFSPHQPTVPPRPLTASLPGHRHSATLPLLPECT